MTAELALLLVSATVLVKGSADMPDIPVNYEYRRGSKKMITTPDLKLEVRRAGARVTVLQSEDQAKRASEQNLQLYINISTPNRTSFEARLINGTVHVSDIARASIQFENATIDVRNTSGPVVIDGTNGTINVSSLPPRAHHSMHLQTGTIRISYVYDIEDFISAQVVTGTVTSDTGGALKKLGITGWMLRPESNDPSTSVECTLEVGSIVVTRARGSADHG